MLNQCFQFSIIYSLCVKLSLMTETQCTITFLQELYIIPLKKVCFLNRFYNKPLTFHI